MTIGNGWLADWRDRRLTARQWIWAAGGFALAAFLYCELSGLTAGNGGHLPLSAAWSLLVVGVFALTAAALAAWRRALPAPAAVTLVGSVTVLMAGGALLVAGENALGYLYWQRPWSGFAADLVVRAPVMLLVVALLDGPRWLARAESARRCTALEIPTRDGPVSVPVRAVSRIVAAGNYVEVHTVGRCLLLRATLTSLAERLAGEGFVRVHRAVLVNPAFVVAVRTDGRGARTIHLRDGARVRVGRRHAAAADGLVATHP